MRLFSGEVEGVGFVV